MDFPNCYWVTRDRVCGQLSDNVELWGTCPERFRAADGDVMWIAARDGKGVAYIGEITVAACMIQIRTYPEDDRQLLRVGEPGPVQVGD